MNKTMEELIAENKELKETIKQLEEMIYSGGDVAKKVANKIRFMIREKVNKECKKDNFLREKARRQLMQDLKWDLRIRTNDDFEQKHIEEAREYMANYEIDEFFKI